MGSGGRTIQARLDGPAQAALEKLARRWGWTTSRIVRHALRQLGEREGPVRRRGILGVGQFASGQRDLGSNPEHLRGMGR